MSKSVFDRCDGQQARNRAVVNGSLYMRDKVASDVLPFQIDIDATDALSAEQVATLQALEIASARTAIQSLASLATIGELDHLGGGLDLIPALTLTLALTDYEKVEYTIENAHCSIGYYSVLSSLGFVSAEKVINEFRRGIDIPGHVSWVPGGTQLNGGRLGIMIPVAVGQALAKKAVYGRDSWVICHCGDAGWISGQALNGFNGADLHNAPVTFVMHRNGIQLSGSNKQIMDKDPRPIIESLGITIIETPTLTDPAGMFQAYKKARALALEGRPSLIYPVGFQSTPQAKHTLRTFAEKFNCLPEMEAFAGERSVSLDTEIWEPGSPMSYRDVIPMIECLFLVNSLPGGKGHHDGSMKGRDEAAVLGHPMMTWTDAQTAALKALQAAPARQVVTKARPAPGSPNLPLSAEAIAKVKLPAAGANTSPRAGVEVGYAAVAEQYPESCFIVGCDLDPSTKLGKASNLLPPGHVFEMSIEEQVATLMADGLAMATDKPQLNVMSTFAAFFEGIAREGMELWRYQRNLNGINEGLNATMHLSHVGSCTGRDHFSGWALDWINLAIGYMPYLDRFYAPADARAAFIAVKDLAARYGASIIGIPRDNLPVLSKQGSDEALWKAEDEWQAVTPFRATDGAQRVILAFGAVAFVAEDAAAQLAAKGIPTDVIVINGLPLPDGFLAETFDKYTEGVVTMEDGLIGCQHSGLRGFAALVNSNASGRALPLAHIGISDPRIAPADGHMETWAHFGLTAEALVQAVESL